jgi:hypothetical protein
MKWSMKPNKHPSFIIFLVLQRKNRSTKIMLKRKPSMKPSIKSKQVPSYEPP